MVDGAHIHYVVDLIYTADGEVFRQGFTLMSTEHEDVARDYAGTTKHLSMAKRMHKRRGPEYSLRVRRVTQTITTEHETI